MSKLYTSSPGGRTKRTSLAKSKGQPASASDLIKGKHGRLVRSAISGKLYSSTAVHTRLHTFQMLGAATDHGTDLPRRKKKAIDRAEFAKRLLKVAGPSAPPGFVVSADTRIGFQVDRAEVRNSKFLAEARARLDALPPGFSDDIRNAGPWPAGAPELLGRDED